MKRNLFLGLLGLATLAWLGTVLAGVGPGTTPPSETAAPGFPCVMAPAEQTPAPAPAAAVPVVSDENRSLMERSYMIKVRRKEEVPAAAAQPMTPLMSATDEIKPYPMPAESVPALPASTSPVAEPTPVKTPVTANAVPPVMAIP